MKKTDGKKLGQDVSEKQALPKSKRQQNAELLLELAAAIRTTVKGHLPKLGKWQFMPNEPGLIEAVQAVEKKRGVEIGDLFDFVDELRERKSKKFLKLRFGDMYGTWQAFSAWLFPTGYTAYIYDILDGDDSVILAVSENGLDENLALQIIDSAFADQFETDGSCSLDIVSVKTTLTVRSPVLNKLLARNR